MKANFVKAWRKLIFRLPCRLPHGMKELEGFTNSILDTYNLPNNDTMHFAMANMIMRSEQTQSHIPKRVFAKALMNQMAKEVAFHREKQLREERKEAAEKAKLEAEAAQPEKSLEPLQNEPVQST